MIDFGELAEGEAAEYELPFEYVRRVVKPVRVENRDVAMRTYWWLQGRSRPAMRKAVSTLHRYIAALRVAKHRVFVWLYPPFVPDHKLCAIARADDYFLAYYNRPYIKNGHSPLLLPMVMDLKVDDQFTLQLRALKPSRSLGHPATSHKTISASKPSPTPPVSASRSATAGPILRAWTRPSSRSAPSPTCTTSVRPGSTWRTSSSTTPSSMPTAGRMTSMMRRSWRGCWR